MRVMGRAAWVAWYAATGVVMAAACALDREGMLDQATGTGGSTQSVGGATTATGGAANVGGGPVVSSSTGVGGSGMLGDPCGQDMDCESDHCADGICCNHDCMGTCESCNQMGMEGTCQPIPAYNDPDGECETDEACDGSGDCAGVLGVSCDEAGDCISNECIDQVCCDTSCGGKCRACDITGDEGTCTFYTPADGDPDDECPNNDVCDGAGMCM
jgi:hypothetical protein